MHDFDTDKIQTITITWQIKDQPVYYLLLGRDGSVHRLGDGQSRGETNMYMGSDASQGMFKSLLSLLARTDYEFGSRDTSGGKAPASSLEILLYENPREATGYEFLSDSPVLDVPEPIQNLLAASLAISAEWWLREKQAHTLNTPHSPSTSAAANPLGGLGGLLKSLLPGLLPLIVFMVVSELWGDMAGVWVGTALGVVEFVVILIVQRRLDAFVLVDTALLVGTGLVSVLLADDIFFRFKPVIMELILVAIMGVSAYGPRDLLVGMALRGEAARKIRDGVDANPGAKHAMRSMMRGIFWVLCAHTLLGAAAALWMSLEAWGFVTGILPVLLLAGWFVVQVLVLRIKRRRIGARKAPR